MFSGYCKPNIIRNFLLSISTLNIFKIYNGAHHEMFLNFRAPNSYKLHAYKNWIINTLIIINVSFLYYEVGFFSFCLLQFVCCYLILPFYFFCNIFGLDGSKCFLSSNCTQLKSMCISANDSARVDMWRSSWNRQWFNGCIFYTMIHSFEAIREFMIKLENRPPQKNEFIIICHDRTGSPNDVR